MKDPIVEEVRRVRKKIEAEHGNDWDCLPRHLIRGGEISVDANGTFATVSLCARSERNSSIITHANSAPGSHTPEHRSPSLFPDTNS